MAAKRRGRPPGSKNKVHLPVTAKPAGKRRGRPPGSKNRPTAPVAPPAKSGRVLQVGPKALAATPAKRKKKDCIVVTDESRKARLLQKKMETSADVAKGLTVMGIAEWLAPKVGKMDKEYWQKEARKNHTTYEEAVALGLIGFFTLDAPELKKQILDKGKKDGNTHS